MPFQKLTGPEVSALRQAAERALSPSASPSWRTSLSGTEARCASPTRQQGDGP